MSTTHHTALITGSTQGIGLAIAQCLAQAGHSIIVHGIESDEAGRAIVQNIIHHINQSADAKVEPVRVAYVRADLSKADEAADLYRRATAALAAPDIVVNNAGIQHTSPIESFPDDRWQSIIAINLSSAFYLMRAAVPAMRQMGWGRIVNIASVHGLVASVNKAAYLAAKHGIVGLSKGVALETATDHITVNCVCPGWTDTPLIAAQIEARAKMVGGDRAAGVRDLLREKQPNLTLLPPKQIGEVVTFLCSESASGITGVALPVDGGWTAQ